MVTLSETLESLGYESSLRRRALIKNLLFSKKIKNHSKLNITSKEIDKLLATTFKTLAAGKDFINAQCQKYMLRDKKIKDRVTTKELNIEESTRNEIISALKDIGRIDEIYPKQKNYDGILLLGGSEKNMHSRISFLKKLLGDKINFHNKLYILSGERDLWPLLEDCTAHILARRTNLELETIRESFDRLNDREKIIKEFKNVKWPNEMDMILEMLNKDSVCRNLDIIPIEEGQNE